MNYKGNMFIPIFPIISYFFYKTQQEQIEEEVNRNNRNKFKCQL
jgi:hypothetical protein